MTTTDLARLTDVFRVIFNDPSLELRDGLTAVEVAGWDSFNHINLMLQIEQEFHIRFSHAEVGALKDVGALKRLIDAKLSAS